MPALHGAVGDVPLLQDLLGTSALPPRDLALVLIIFEGGLTFDFQLTPKLKLEILGNA